MAKIKDLRKKLADARKTCPGMSEKMYLITDYMSENLNDELEPGGLLIQTVLVINDLDDGRNGFSAGSVKFPDELKQNRLELLAEIKLFPQVVDAIADEEFATAFRQEWKIIFETVPPRKINTQEIKIDSKWPGYVKAAVDWWAKQIVSPKFDNGEELPSFLATMLANSAKEYKAEEIKIFKDTLAREIEAEMLKYGECRLDVDYHPCSILAEAGDKIGVPNMVGSWPCKTQMWISKNDVWVVAGYSAEAKRIWLSLRP